MSTIKTETLSTPSNSTVPVDTVVNGTAKAWVNFNGTGTVAIRRAFNVSSITDNGTGDYTVNFTTAMADENYATNVTPQATAVNTGLMGCLRHSSTPTTSGVRVSVHAVDAGFRDTSYANVTIFS